MWYVNVEGQSIDIAKAEGFYINYVVCKYRWSKKTYGGYAWFYINYVVCKLIMNTITAIGQIVFYINYVVCKYVKTVETLIKRGVVLY